MKELMYSTHSVPEPEFEPKAADKHIKLRFIIENLLKDFLPLKRALWAWHRHLLPGPVISLQPASWEDRVQGPLSPLEAKERGASVLGVLSKRPWPLQVGRLALRCPSVESSPVWGSLAQPVPGESPRRSLRSGWGFS